MQSSPHSISVCFPMLLNRYTKTVQINVRRLGQLNHLKAFSCFAQNSFGVSFNSTSFTQTSQLYSSLIQLCMEENSSADVGKIQIHMIKSGFYINFGHKLMHAYVRGGSMEDARKVFDELPNRLIVTWNSIISSYVSHRRCEDAIGIYGWMVLKGVLPDEYTFSSVFKAFSYLGLVREGRRAHGLSVILGLEVLNVFVGSALVDMYAKFGKMRDARLVMDRVVEKDVVLFTALIVGYTQHGEDGEALEVFAKMINEGIKANEYTIASILISCGNLKDSRKGKLIHALVIKSGFESVVASQTSLLTMYSRCGLIVDSLKVFKRFSNPNQVTWTSLMVGLVQNGGEGIALTKFRQMIRSSIIPNSFTLSTALQACSKLSKLEEGKQIHAILTKLNLDEDKYVGAALIDMYGKCGSTEMARSAFDALIEFDLVSANSMIYCYAQNGFAYEALELFNRIKDFGLESNDVTFGNVLLACSNAGLVEEGCRIFASVRNNQNIELTKDHYASMVDLLGRSGRLEEAEMLIEQVRNPDLVLWRILLSACKIHGEVERAERVVNRALELAPGDERTHALLSNLYASSGNWNQFIEVKSEMKEMKLKKISAMSLVDIDKDVHTSNSEDLSHQRSRKISEMLEELIEKVKKYGGCS